MAPSHEPKAPGRDKPRVLVWDDEVSAGKFRLTDQLFEHFVLCVRPDADQWATDVRHHRPVLALLDNDMGRDARPGWSVLEDLKNRWPLLPVICISDNTVAVLRMRSSGAPTLKKARVLYFLQTLDERWLEVVRAEPSPIREAALSELINERPTR